MLHQALTLCHRDARFGITEAGAIKRNHFALVLLFEGGKNFEVWASTDNSMAVFAA